MFLQNKITDTLTKDSGINSRLRQATNRYW